MAADDGAMRERLVEDGSLFDGYNPLMAIVHRRNGDRLAEMVDAYGWPGATMVGEDGADAAWLVLHHAIGDPVLQRRCLPLLVEAAVQGEIPAWHPATLLDGIRFYEGRPQVYGSMFDWDESGRLVPWAIEDAERRRRAPGVGGPAAAGRPGRKRAGGGRAGGRPPAGRPGRAAGRGRALGALGRLARLNPIVPTLGRCVSGRLQLCNALSARTGL